MTVGRWWRSHPGLEIPTLGHSSFVEPSCSHKEAREGELSTAPHELPADDSPSSWLRRPVNLPAHLNSKPTLQGTEKEVGFLE